MSEEAPRRSVPGPVIVLPLIVIAAAVVSIAAYWLFSTAHSAPGPPPSIAVLPFESKSAQFLGDGVAEQVIEELGQIPDFLTIARTSAFAMRGEQNVQEIGRKLNVRTVLLGTLEHSGDRVEVSERLMSAQDGAQLWSKNYDRAADEIFGIEDEIARGIVDALGLRLPVPLEHATATSLGAYECYLRDCNDMESRPHGHLLDAIGMDPQYAPAYAALAEANVHDDPARALEMAKKALDLDPQLLSPHVVLGELAARDWNWKGARGEFERGLAINSADPRAMAALAMWYLAPMGNVKDAIGEMNHVQDIDPLNPTVRMQLGTLDNLDHQFGAAIELLKNDKPNEALFQAYLGAGRIEEARGANPNIDNPEMLAAEGKADEARRILATDHVSPFRAACAYARMGDKDRAIDQLEIAYRQHEEMLAYLKTWPVFDTLRSDPRFQALLKKLNLA